MKTRRQIVGISVQLLNLRIVEPVLEIHIAVHRRRAGKQIGAGIIRLVPDVHLAGIRLR